MLEVVHKHFLLTQTMQSLCRDWDVKVRRVGLIPTPPGGSPQSQIVGLATKEVIFLRDDLGGCDLLFTWIHEFAHTLLHCSVPPENPCAEWLDNRFGFPITAVRGMREAEADGIAKHVCETIGIDHPMYEWESIRMAYDYKDFAPDVTQVTNIVLNRWDVVCRYARSSRMLRPLFAGHERFPIRNLDLWRAAK